MASAVKGRRAWWGIFGLMLSLVLAPSLQAAPTPLEKAEFKRISHSEEISAFLQALAAQHTEARYEVLGKSVQGRPLDALIIARPMVKPVSEIQSSPFPAQPASSHLKVMIVGSQHGGAEPAGGEALLVIARDLLEGDLRPLLDTLDVVLLPNANPDGRDLERRSNANMININTDFVLMSQPESQILAAAVRRYQPDVVLDSHESAVLKRTTLAKEGYLTDFYAQFESANNPAVPSETRQFTLDAVLPELISRVTKLGLPAHRYIGEITSIHQPITDGGLTLKNFRNMAGLNGALSFLVETRLDSRDETYPTYRNIGERVERQLICLRAFLDTMATQKTQVEAQVSHLREAMNTQPVAMAARYVADQHHPDVAIALRRLDNHELQTLIFPDHRKMIADIAIPMPKSLVITDHVAEMAQYLQKHQISYETLTTPRELDLIPSRYLPGASTSKTSGNEGVARPAASKKNVRIPAGSLWVDLSQPTGRLAVSLLDPRSISSVFHYSPYASMLTANRDFFIYPVP